MRENLPTSVEIFIDDSFVEFLDKFSRTKVDNLHLWNRMQSQVSLELNLNLITKKNNV